MVKVTFEADTVEELKEIARTFGRVESTTTESAPKFKFLGNKINEVKEMLKNTDREISEICHSLSEFRCRLDRIENHTGLDHSTLNPKEIKKRIDELMVEKSFIPKETKSTTNWIETLSEESCPF